MSKVAAVMKKTAQEEYAACKQGPFKHIMDYKKRFDAKLDTLTVIGNAAASDADIEMDFMYGLDNTRYAEFKVEVVNDMQKGSSVTLDDLNKMFATVDQTPRKGSNPKGGSSNDNAKGGKPAAPEESEKLKFQNAASKLAKNNCFNCGGKGRPARNCPHKEKMMMNQ
jgi:hypothetical protein